MTRLTKKQSERIHATNRAKQRYNLEYTKEIRSLIKHKISTNKTILVKRVSNTRTVRLIEIKEQIHKIVWDSLRQEVVTFLPIKEEDLEYVKNPNLSVEEYETISRKNNKFKTKSKKFIVENEELFKGAKSFKDFIEQVEKQENI